MKKVKDIPEWYALYRDVNIQYGGLFVNPDTNEGIEVIDLDSSAGVDYCNLIVRGSFYVDADKIKNGGECCGVDTSIVNGILRAWIVFSNKYYGIHRQFAEVFPPDSKYHNLMLQGFELSFSYMGFDGYTENTLILPKRTRNTQEWDSYTENQAKELGEQWKADYILTTNPEREIKRILKLEGIKL